MSKDKNTRAASIDISGTDNLIKEASSEVKSLLDQAFINLKSIASLKVDGQPSRLFFPNGIELIYAKLAVGLPEKPVVAVEVRIAGEKGIKATGGDSQIEVNEQMAATSRSEQ